MLERREIQQESRRRRRREASPKGAVLFLILLHHKDHRRSRKPQYCISHVTHVFEADHFVMPSSQHARVIRAQVSSAESSSQASNEEQGCRKRQVVAPNCVYLDLTST